MKAVLALFPLVLLTACATPLRSYSPAQHQEVVYNQGVGAVTWQGDGAVLTMYPTFRYQSPGDIPTFTLMVQNTSNRDIDFVPETITASLDGQACHVYTLEERVSEIRRAARRKQITLAVLGGVAAGASAYAASHSSATYTSFGAVGNRPFYTTGTIQTYDPAAGILAGAAVSAGTGIGIQQIARAAGYEERAAQAIFQHTTIRPGMTVVGQVMIKAAPKQFDALNFEVPVAQADARIGFEQVTTSD